MGERQISRHVPPSEQPERAHPVTSPAVPSRRASRPRGAAAASLR
ncbi:hypothetical protein [Streptomyces alanosinicus]|nr:hypothetical protein [Streptomyces alanosinicus]